MVASLCSNELMNTREDFGWSDDDSCPPWCVNDDLKHRVDLGVSDTWHKGLVNEIPTTTYNDEPDSALVYVSQLVRGDERGSNAQEAEVVIDHAGSFTPSDARKLAKVLATLADLAEADTERRKGDEN